jgi:metallopeptidase MepB
MNLTAPQPKKPTLLKQDHIRSLFHELGHAIHNLSTRVKYSALHGNLSRDFLEIPSIMLENWCWTPSVIKELGYHYSYISDAFLEAWKESSEDTDIRPNRILDDEMIENLINSRHTNQSVGVLRQCHIGTFDMAIHSPSSHEEAEAMNPSEMWNRLMSEVTMLSGMEKLDGRWDWGHGCARLGALVRGYDAGYYAYPL